MFRICEECCLPNSSAAAQCVQCKSPLSNLPRRDGTSLAGALIEKRYRLEDFVGEGAMAWVYRGVHVDLGSSVAVKILKPSFAQDQRFLARFKKEATAVGALSHPNIMSVITSGDTPSGLPYMVCEFIKGASLAGIIEREGRLPLPRALNIFSQILSALDEAHERGIVHRDLKPDNIMVMSMRSGEDFCKIVDFGIAFHAVSNEQRLTQHGEIFGTPEYMAPETIKGQPATAVSDIYAAGIILYEMITGRIPFTGPAIFDVLLAHIEKKHEPPSSLVPDLPQALDAILDKALAKNPADRIQTAGEFKRLLSFPMTAASIKCASCGSEMNANHKFCPHCGATNREMLQNGRMDPKLGIETLERIHGQEKLRIPFFGRDAERTAIRDFLSSRRLCMEITGDDGIGKTALLEAVAADLEHASISMFSCEPDPLGCQRPWWPIRELARRMAGLPETPTLSDILGACMAMELDPQDVPHLLFLFELENDQPPLEFAVRLREMITSVARFVVAAAQARPTLLIFQDVDDFDMPSCRVLEQLYSMIQGHPIKLVTTGKNPLFLPDAMPPDLYCHLRLEPLDPETARDLAFVVLSENSGSWHGSIDDLVQAARGNPLHLVEGMRLLAEGEDEIRLPLGDLVQLRVRRLPKKAQRLLQWLSVWGLVAPPEVLVMAMGPQETVQQVVDACEKRGFLRTLQDGSVQISHRLFSRLILEEMPSTLRAEIHAAILDSEIAGQLDIQSLAFHSLYARRPEQTLSYMERAGASCESRLDDHGAAFYYRHAHELARMETLNGKGESRFARISARYGDLLRYTGKREQALDVLREALSYCTDCPASEATILASMARCMAEDSDARAEDVIQRATRVAQKARDPQVLYRVYHDFGQIELQKGRHDLGITQLRMGLAMLEGHTRMPASVWRLYLQCAQFECMGGHPEKALETCLAALEKPFVTRSLLALGRLHEQIARILMHMRRFPTAVIHLKKAAEYLEQAGDRVSLVENILALGSLDDEMRLEWAENAFSIASRIGFLRGMEQAGQLLTQAS